MWESLALTLRDVTGEGSVCKKIYAITYINDKWDSMDLWYISQKVREAGIEFDSASICTVKPKGEVVEIDMMFSLSK